MFYFSIMYSVVRDAISLQSMQQLLEPVIRKVVSRSPPGNMLYSLFVNEKLLHCCRKFIVGLESQPLPKRTFSYFSGYKERTKYKVQESSNEASKP